MNTINQFLKNPLEDFTNAQYKEITSGINFLNRIINKKKTDLISAIKNKNWPTVTELYNWFDGNVPDDINDTIYSVVLEANDIKHTILFLNHSSVKNNPEKIKDLTNFIFIGINSTQYLNELQIYYPFYIKDWVINMYETSHFADISDNQLRKTLQERFYLQTDIKTLTYAICNKNLDYFTEVFNQTKIIDHFALNTQSIPDYLKLCLVDGMFEMFESFFKPIGFKNKIIPLLENNWITTLANDKLTIARFVTNKNLKDFSIFCDNFPFNTNTCFHMSEGLIKSQKNDNIDYYLSVIGHDQKLLESTLHGASNLANEPFKQYLLKSINNILFYNKLDDQLPILNESIVKKKKI